MAIPNAPTHFVPPPLPPPPYIDDLDLPARLRPGALARQQSLPPIHPGSSLLGGGRPPPRYVLPAAPLPPPTSSVPTAAPPSARSKTLDEIEMRRDAHALADEGYASWSGSSVAATTSSYSAYDRSLVDKLNPARAGSGPRRSSAMAMRPFPPPRAPADDGRAPSERHRLRPLSIPDHLASPSSASASGSGSGSTESSATTRSTATQPYAFLPHAFRSPPSRTGSGAWSSASSWDLPSASAGRASAGGGGGGGGHDPTIYEDAEFEDALDEGPRKPRPLPEPEPSSPRRSRRHSPDHAGTTTATNRKRPASSPPRSAAALGRPHDRLPRRSSGLAGAPRVLQPASARSPRTPSLATRADSMTAHDVTAGSSPSHTELASPVPIARSPTSELDPAWPHGFPYGRSLSLNPSPRGGGHRASHRPHQRTISESQPNPPTSSRAAIAPSAGGVGPGGGSTKPAHGARLFICDCCPKKPKRFETADGLQTHEDEKRYACAYCNNRFKNKNEAERHQNSLHLRRHSWSCAALLSYEAAFHPSSATASTSPTGPTPVLASFSSTLAAGRLSTSTSPPPSTASASTEAHANANANANANGTAVGNRTDVCGYCGVEFARPADWRARVDHLVNGHKFRECNQAKKFFRADHFRQHLKHSHAGTSGKWTNLLEAACMRVEEPDPLPAAAATATFRGEAADAANGGGGADVTAGMARMDRGDGDGVGSGNGSGRGGGGQKEMMDARDEMGDRMNERAHERLDERKRSVDWLAVRPKPDGRRQ
ncbi:MAG: hypothetical protein M1826_003002 [Phylliscum demangeonii]|nr:MAG: hypothetical protein M1826_003002 [Phylliscum demangeonii]